MTALPQKRSIGPRTSVGVHPVLIVGCYDREGRPNAMAVAWGGICSSNPPAVAVSIRPERYTHEGITARKAFTVSVPSERYVEESDLFGIASGRDLDKFAATGLTPVRSERVDACYIGEFPLVLECRLIETVELGAHTQFVGEIVDVLVDEDCLDGDGRPALGRLRPFLYDAFGLGYHGVGDRVGTGFSSGRRFLPR
ncbi:MAG TPA: flavin reductase family protein [Methanoregulaceae archaeon]|mgnify:CR=1 FL=1|nr:flavin reductase family protein [Methanoregulaceae archaeon]HOV67006.1 flavin reductase family protein [Methanoregulaceae archaeon]HQJ87986.1 flavin reductase family protein [Methanoregulaceae archaeon]